MRWVDKYSPRKMEDIVGQGKAVSEIKEWFKNWKPGQALLLCGGPGTGKTASAYAYAAENDLDLIEINASDTRNAENIERIVGGASQQKSLFRKGKIILVDEIDGLAGKEDRGGTGALSKVIKKSKFPIILTANDAYNPKLRAIRKNCRTVKFGKVHLNSITARLSEISEKEGIEVDKKILKQIGRQSGGDLRSAINDLETISAGKKKISDHDLTVGYREREESIFDVLNVIFKTKKLSVGLEMMGNLHKDPDELFWWLEENIPKEYSKKEEIAKAYDALSKADVFRSRVHTRQNWRFKKYMIDLMVGGTSLAKEEAYRKFTPYQPPLRLKMYGMTKSKRKNLNELSQRIGQKIHVSSKIARNSYFPLLKIIFKNKPEWKEKLTKEFELSEDDISIIQS